MRALHLIKDVQLNLPFAQLPEERPQLQEHCNHRSHASDAEEDDPWHEDVLHVCMGACVYGCVCVWVRACMRACARAMFCQRARMRAGGCARVPLFLYEVQG